MKSARSPARRRLLIDTVATMLFFTVVAGTTELLVARMDPPEVLLTRLLMLPVMIATGRPYGIWRDWMFAHFMPRSVPARTLLDIGAFISFQVPVYAATLAMAGAEPLEIGRALGAAIVFMVLLSRPFGCYLDRVRRFCGAGLPAPPM